MIEGNPNSVYSKGMSRSQVYEEAVKFFGSQKDKNNDNLKEVDFLKSKYCVVVDMRTVDEENVVHSGRYLKGVQSGILIKVKKLATSTNLFCHVFVVSDEKSKYQIKGLKASSIKQMDEACKECVEKDKVIDELFESKDESVRRRTKRMKYEKNITINFLQTVILGYIGFRVGCSVANYFKEE